MTEYIFISKSWGQIMLEDQLAIEQISRGSLRSTNQSNLRMKWFTSLEQTFVVKILLVSHLGKKHPMTQNTEYSKGTCLICVFFHRFMYKIYWSQWKRAVNGPGLWLIGVSHMCNGYSLVLFSCGFFWENKNKFHEAWEMTRLFLILCYGIAWCISIFCSSVFGVGTRIRNVGRKWRDLPEFVVVTGFKQLYLLLERILQSRDSLNEDLWSFGTTQISFETFGNSFTSEFIGIFVL